MRVLGVIAVFSLCFWACARECGPSTCAQGCCSNDVCYEGVDVRGGGACQSSGKGGGQGGGGLSPTGGGSGGGSASAVCVAAGKSCTVGGTPCCSFSFGYPVACIDNTCRACAESSKTCSSSMPCCNGTCSSSGSCSGSSSCGTFGDACNDSAPCCVSRSSFRVCRQERCDFCTTLDDECSVASSECCPGLGCRLRPGFSSVYTCQE